MLRAGGISSSAPHALAQCSSLLGGDSEIGRAIQDACKRSPGAVISSPNIQILTGDVGPCLLMELNEEFENEPDDA